MRIKFFASPLNFAAWREIEADHYAKAQKKDYGAKKMQI